MSRIGEALMQAFARVFFQMKTGDADFFPVAAKIDFDESVFGQRFVVLRDLVALRQVRIKVILAREDGNFVDAALERHRRAGCEFYSLPVQHREGSGQAEADRADVRVWRIPETGRA